MLCGDVSTEMFSVLTERTELVIPIRLTAFNSSFGGTYGVLTHQLREHQHRFVLCLYDPEVREFLESAKTEKFGFLLGNDEQTEAVVFSSPIRGVDFVPLLAMSADLNVDQQREMLIELPVVISAMTNPLQVPSIFKNQVVRKVSVSVLLPSVLGMSAKLLNETESAA